jgi:hypothetical protein
VDQALIATQDDLFIGGDAADSYEFATRPPVLSGTATVGGADFQDCYVVDLTAGSHTMDISVTAADLSITFVDPNGEIRVIYRMQCCATWIDIPFTTAIGGDWRICVSYDGGVEGDYTVWLPTGGS